MDDELVQRHTTPSSPSPTASVPDQSALQRIPVLSAAVLQRLFDLTAAEARLACSISGGETLGEAAAPSRREDFDRTLSARVLEGKDWHLEAGPAGRSSRLRCSSGG